MRTHWLLNTTGQGGLEDKGMYYRRRRQAPAVRYLVPDLDAHVLAQSLRALAAWHTDNGCHLRQRSNLAINPKSCLWGGNTKGPGEREAMTYYRLEGLSDDT